MAKMWFMTPTNSNIQVVKRDTNKSLADYLECRFTDHITLVKNDKEYYYISFDDEGMYRNTLHNVCAEKLLRKIRRINWGTFNGNFIVIKYEYDNDVEKQVDMDLTPREFITMANQLIR